MAMINNFVKSFKSFSIKAAKSFAAKKAIIISLACSIPILI